MIGVRAKVDNPWTTLILSKLHTIRKVLPQLELANVVCFMLGVNIKYILSQCVYIFRRTKHDRRARVDYSP